MPSETLIARIELVTNAGEPMSTEEACAEEQNIQRSIKPYLIANCPGIKGARVSTRIVQEGGNTYYEVLDTTPGSRLLRIEDIGYKPD